MKNITLCLLIASGLFFSTNALAQRGHSHSSSSYHSGHYKNGQGSSHKGGHYKNSSTNNHYRKRH